MTASDITPEMIENEPEHPISLPAGFSRVEIVDMLDIFKDEEQIVDGGEWKQESTAGWITRLLRTLLATSTTSDLKADCEQRIRSALVSAPPAEIDRLKAENAELKAWISDSTKKITEAVGGGSELFVRKGDEFRADIDFCCARIRSRANDMRESNLTAFRRATAAEARIAELEAENKRIREATESFMSWFQRFICNEDALNSSTPHKVSINARDAADELLAILLKEDE